MKTFQLAFAALLTGSVLTSTSFAEDPVPAKSAEAATVSGKDIGLSSRDGIALSGTDVLVTRNGVTAKATKEIQLQNGVLVKPDGTVVANDGSKFMLRPDQVLGFDGKLVAPAETAPTTSTATTTTTVTTKPAATTPTDSARDTTHTAAVEAEKAEADRRARAAAAAGESAANPSK